MSLIPFFMLFPQQGTDETRTITNDAYALVEYYCPDPDCDCRRVLINVLPRENAEGGFLASISFGFDRDTEDAGPYLDPLNPQSEYAGVLFDMVSAMLHTDAAYVARLEAHYHLVKKIAADPTPLDRRRQAHLLYKTQRILPQC